MNRVVVAFEAMRAALAAAAPNAIANLHPPAAPLALESMEATLGRALHPDLRALLELHDGQDPSPPLFDDEWLCGVSLEGWLARKELFDARELAQGWWDPRWVPVTDSDGSGFHLHLDTGEVRLGSPQGAPASRVRGRPPLAPSQRTPAIPSLTPSPRSSRRCGGY
jgi:cell wall assembly regulator SMI1